MSKLDLRAARAIRVAQGEVAALKGPGFSWARPAGGFTPASLFAGGERGFFFDFAAGNVFTDTARTTPATVGAAVAGLTDLSPNAQHATMATVASRPVMQSVSTRLRAFFDGTDDRMDLTCNMTGVTSATLWAVIEKTGDVQGGRVLGNDLSGGAFALFSPASASDTRYRLAIGRTDNGFGRDVFSAIAYPAPDLAYLVGWTIGDNVANPSGFLRRNGAQVGTSSATNLWSGLGSQTWRIGNSQFSNQRYTGGIYAIGLIGRSLTTQELTNLETWCATRAGL